MPSIDSGRGGDARPAPDAVFSAFLSVLARLEAAARRPQLAKAVRQRRAAPRA